MLASICSLQAGAALIPEVRIPDACGRTTDEQDRMVPGLLQLPHEHQALKMADVQAGGAYQ